MDDSDLIIVIVFIFGFLLIIIAFSNKKEPEVKRKKVTDRPDLIQDDKVTMKLVEEKIDGFKIFVNPKRKIGFTEKDVQIELESFLKDIFQNVTREHGVESKNAKAIDFDIGNGKVGIEVKLAVEIFKEGGWDRAIGQMVKYTRLKYNNENLIFLVAGFEEDLRNSMLSEFEDDVYQNKCQFKFVSAGSKKQIKNN